MLCYVVLCCTVLCCAVLCCVVPCCVVLCCAVLCCVVLCYAALCCVVLCCVVLCCAVLCCALLCCVVLCCTVLFCLTSCHVISFHSFCLILFYCTYADNSRLLWTNRKAGSPDLHMATAQQLNLQQTVARWQRWQLTYDENVWGVLWSGRWTGLFSEPPMEADEQEVAKMVRLRDVGFTADFDNVG